MKAPGRGAAGAAFLLLVPALLAASASGNTYEGPGRTHTEFVSVTPSADLHSGEKVEVSGYGFKPNLTVAFNMCTLVVTGYNDCDPSTTKLPSAHVSASGTFGPAPYTVTEQIRIPAQRNVEVVCGKGNCSVGVGDPSGLTAGSHCVNFTPEPCAPAPADHFASAPNSGSSGGLGAGAIAGIIVAVLVVLGAVAWLIRPRPSGAHHN